MNWDVLIFYVAGVLLFALVVQIRGLRMQLARDEIRAVYDRYLELTKVEVEHPTLHKMFLYGPDVERLAHLTTEELRERALSLLILDQFAFLFNTNRPSVASRAIRQLCRWVPIMARTGACQRALDRMRTPWEINAGYVAGVLTNPLLIRSWQEWGLGETWRGSQFHEYVEGIIASWHRSRAHP